MILFPRLKTRQELEAGGLDEASVDSLGLREGHVSPPVSPCHSPAVDFHCFFCLVFFLGVLQEAGILIRDEKLLCSESSAALPGCEVILLFITVHFCQR